MPKIRTVFGAVEVKNPRWMLCQRCLPHTWMAVTVLSEICPDQAMPELMEVTARLGSMHDALSQGRGAIGWVPPY
jgi:hypothetical protein